MTEDEILNILNEDYGSYGKFQDTENKRSQRRDLHAFAVLDELVPGNQCMVSDAQHDIIYLDVTLAQMVNSAVTADTVRDLRRCGIHYDEGFDCLAMFT